MAYERLVARSPGVITGCVFLREPLGLDDEVLVEAADGTRVRVVTAGGEDFPEGAPVGVDLTPRDLYVFDPVSRNTLCYGVD